MAEPQPRRDAPPRGVLSLEAAAKATITKSIDQIARQAAILGMHPATAAMLIGSSAALGITKAREAAAERSAISFERQTGLDAQPLEYDEESRAEWATDGLRARFVDEVQKQSVQGLTGALGYTAAARAMRAAIERTVTTEVMHAWNAETRRQAAHAKTDVIQTWNADADACEKCAPYAGTKVRNGEMFPDGDPPLHPHCLCTIDCVTDRAETEDRVSETRLKAVDENAERRAAFTTKQVAVEKEVAAERARFAEARKRADEAKRLAAKAKAKAARKAIAVRPKPVPFESLPIAGVPHEPASFAGMTDEEFKAYAVTIGETFSANQRRTIREFTGSDYGNIRRVQRLSKTAAVRMYGQREYRAYLDAIDHLDALHTPERMVACVTYRGISGLRDDIFAKVMSQDEMVFVGTSSTSRSPKQALPFAVSDNAVLFKIHQRTGVPVEAIGIDYEREIIIKNGTKFRVMSRSRILKKDQRMLLIELEEM
jgi:hypothetical protein